MYIENLFFVNLVCLLSGGALTTLLSIRSDEVMYRAAGVITSSARTASLHSGRGLPSILSLCSRCMLPNSSLSSLISWYLVSKQIDFCCLPLFVPCGLDWQETSGLCDHLAALMSVWGTPVRFYRLQMAALSTAAKPRARTNCFGRSRLKKLPAMPAANPPSNTRYN